MKEALDALKQHIAFVDTDDDKVPYETPWRGGERGESAVVFFPTTTEAVQDIVKACHTHHWPLIPQGGNTGLVFGSTPPAHSEKPPVIVNLQRMKNLIGDIDTVRHTVTAQAGMIVENLKNQMQERGYLFSVDMGSKGSAQLAGAASTNAGGTNFLRYGGMREQVVGLKVVLPDGSLLDAISHVPKDNTGFPLMPLFLGAEGTLGIITELQLKLHPLPKQRATALLAMQDAAASLALLQRFRRQDAELLSAFELISANAYRLVVNRPGKIDPFAGKTYPDYILMEFTSPKTDDLQPYLQHCVEAGFEAGLVLDAILDKPETLWAIREGISEAASHAGNTIPSDVSVPIGQIPLFLTEMGKEITEKWAGLGLKICYFGHLGDGNLHYNLLQPKDTVPAITKEQREEVEAAIAKRVIAMGGSPVAEHGIGRKNIAALRAYKNPVALAVMKQIKQALDPHNIMNPYVFF